MVQFTNSQILNEMLQNSFNIYNNLEKKNQSPNPIKYLCNQFFMNYVFNQLTLMSKDYNKEYFDYINHLKNTYPLGFGVYFEKYLSDELENENLLDIYYDLKAKT